MDPDVPAHYATWTKKGFHTLDPYQEVLHNTPLLVPGPNVRATTHQRCVGHEPRRQARLIQTAGLDWLKKQTRIYRAKHFYAALYHALLSYTLLSYYSTLYYTMLYCTTLYSIYIYMPYYVCYTTLYCILYTIYGTVYTTHYILYTPYPVL